MREVMKWSKDYRTGEVVTEKAYKPENLKGKATIQLRDANGDLKQEVETHNIIIPMGYASGHEHYEMLYQSLMASLNYPMGCNYSSQTVSAFGNILLSDSDAPEDETNMFYKGSTIGWCPRTDQNAGSDVTRGVYNPTESYVKYEEGYYHAHLVYDFGTSQGNGEFNSIWWVPATLSDTKGNAIAPFRISRYALRYRKSTLPLSGSAYKRNTKGQLCKVDGGNWYTLLNTKAALNGIEAPNFSVNANSGSERITYVWAYENGARRNAISSTNFSESTSSTVTAANLRLASWNIKDYSTADETFNEKTINIFSECPDLADCYEKAFTQGRTSALLYNYICFTDEKGVRWGYLYCSTNSSSYKNFPSIDSSGTITPDSSSSCYFLYAYDTKNMAWVLKPGLTYDSMYLVNTNSSARSGLTSNTDKKLLYDNKILLLSGNSYLYLFDTKELTFSTYSYTNFYNSNDGTTSTSTTTYCFAPYDIIITSDNGWGFRIIRAYNAHTKLPNKVTKTSADTMKIQYDYYIQIPYTFTDDDNYIPPLD